MTSNTPTQPVDGGGNTQGIDPDFYNKAMAKREIYQRQTASDRNKITETRALAGTNNMEDYINEHQEYVKEMENGNNNRALPAETLPNPPVGRRGGE
mmetsp:Transcript_21651/g.45145  ORF Transcript_21651/g.45145 Transcript_21651/m.45145 type:complete len:97 (+) Transcript_21651:25-315(+)